MESDQHRVTHTVKFSIITVDISSSAALMQPVCCFVRNGKAEVDGETSQKALVLSISG